MAEGITKAQITGARLSIKKQSVQQISAVIGILSLLTLVLTFYLLPGVSAPGTGFTVALLSALLFFLLYLFLPHVYLNETFLMVADAVYVIVITYAAMKAGQYGILILFLYFVLIVADALKYPLSEYVIVVIVSIQAAFFYILVGSPFPLAVRWSIFTLFLFSSVAIAVFVWYFVYQTIYERSMRYVLERRSKYLKTMNDHLKAVDAMRTTMLRVTSHEFQTPLAAIRSSLALIRNHKLGDLTTAQLGFVEAAAANNDRLQLMMRDLLDASRIESGNWQLQRSDVDITKMVKDLVKEYEPVSVRQQNTLVYKPTKEAITISADANLIRIAFKNLLDNACKYTPQDGTITVKLSQTATDVVFSVTDTGPGISSEDRDHLFSQFYRSDSAISADPNGFGIGLYHSKAIVRRHGGDINAESKAGQGSIFTITLPKATMEPITKTNQLAAAPAAEKKEAKNAR